MRPTKVAIDLPENYQSHQRKYFRKATIKLPNLKIKKLHNVFVSENGLVMKDYPFIKPLVKESIYRYPSKYFGFVEDGIRRYRKSQKDRNGVKFEADTNYFTIVTPWSSCNYYHWLLDSIPRLMNVHEKFPEATLLIWRFFQKSDFLNKSLLPFLDLKIQIVPDDRLVQVKNLILPELRHYCRSYDLANLTKIRSIYLNYFGTSYSLGPRVYISRKSNRRKIVNEAEVEALLRNYDFEIVDFDQIPFEKQISIMSHTDTLISTHGAALTNMVFLPPGSKVLEFHRQKITSFDHHSKSYWYLCNYLGHRYYHQICEPKGEYKADFFQADFYVDIHELENNIHRMLYHQ